MGLLLSHEYMNFVCLFLCHHLQNKGPKIFFALLLLYTHFICYLLLCHLVDMKWYIILSSIYLFLIWLICKIFFLFIIYFLCIFIWFCDFRPLFPFLSFSFFFLCHYKTFTCNGYIL